MLPVHVGSIVINKEFNMVRILPYIYFIIISFVAVVVTALDKRNARYNAPRVSEETLFLISILGGSAAMYFTMRAIRHKTKHKRFMIGIPVIMMLQLALLISLLILI